MTQASIKEYTEVVRVRYHSASKKEKGKILDEFIAVVGCHRKSAVRLLRGKKRVNSSRKRGRQREYGTEVVDLLRVAWEATDRLCSTKPGSMLKNSIPIRTFAEWDEERPGFLEVDLVHHCGESVDGFYLTTLSAVDVASGWSECMAVWGKNQERVGSAIHRIRQRLPFPLLGLDSDNGSEFINHHLFTYCQREGINFTRSRSYKKNDSCHIEQKNWSVIRRLVGYDRYSSKTALETLDRIYRILRFYVNFFQPTMKLLAKTRHGAKVHKFYGTAQTPYQRLLRSGVLTEEKRHELATIYHGLNPTQLLEQLNGNLERLWDLAEHPTTRQRQKTKNYVTPVTPIYDAMTPFR